MKRVSAVLVLMLFAGGIVGCGKQVAKDRARATNNTPNTSDDSPQSVDQTFIPPED